MSRTTGMLLGLSLLAVALGASRPAIAAGVVAETQTSPASPIATLAATLDARQRYSLQIDGRAGAAFSAATVETYVNAQATLDGSVDRGRQFQGTAPHTLELTAPQADLRYWRYAAVVTPTQGDNLVVRLVAADAN
jgi:hypothetical protein